MASESGKEHRSGEMARSGTRDDRKILQEAGAGNPGANHSYTGAVTTVRETYHLHCEWLQ